MIRSCLECGKPFTVYGKQKVCSDLCYKNRLRRKHKEPHYKEYQKIYQRNNRLTLDGRTGHQPRVTVHKRPFQGVCELCENPIVGKSHPIWHHWDDEHMEIGMWTDWNCHRICEAVEHDLNNELMDKYRWMKYLLGGNDGTT